MNDTDSILRIASVLGQRSGFNKYDTLHLEMNLESSHTILDWCSLRGCPSLIRTANSTWINKDSSVAFPPREKSRSFGHEGLVAMIPFYFFNHR